MKTWQADAWLQEYSQKAIAVNVPTEYQHQIGDSGPAIWSVAQQWKADLIIVLSRYDQSAIAEFFTGSVSNYVVHYEACSVLVVKEGELTGVKVL